MEIKIVLIVILKKEFVFIWYIIGEFFYFLGIYDFVGRVIVEVVLFVVEMENLFVKYGY